MKNKEVWIVKMVNNEDASECDRWMFPGLDAAIEFLGEYLPSGGIVEMTEIDDVMEEVKSEAEEYLDAEREFDEGGFEIFTVCTATPKVEDYIVK